METNSQDESIKSNQSMICSCCDIANIANNNIANNGLIRRSSFISQISSDLYNQFYNQLMFNSPNWYLRQGPKFRREIEHLLRACTMVQTAAVCKYMEHRTKTAIQTIYTVFICQALFAFFFPAYSACFGLFLLTWYY